MPAVANCWANWKNFDSGVSLVNYTGSARSFKRRLKFLSFIFGDVALYYLRHRFDELLSLKRKAVLKMVHYFVFRYECLPEPS